MAQAHLFVQGQDFPVNHKLLLAIAENLPEDENYAELARALFKLGIPSIMEELVGKDNLTQDCRDAAWASGDLQLRRTLMDNTDFLSGLTDEQARELMRLDDLDMLKSLAGWAELLYPNRRDRERARRLSRGMADKVMRYLARHPRVEVRAALLENRSAPVRFRPACRLLLEDLLAQEAEEDVILDLLAGSMRSRDLPLLERMSRSALMHLAAHIEDIADRYVRGKVGDFLIAYPDPAVRLELAENTSAPASMLEKLLDDEDEDVAAQARQNLDEWHNDEDARRRARRRRVEWDDDETSDDEDDDELLPDDDDGDEDEALPDDDEDEDAAVRARKNLDNRDDE